MVSYKELAKTISNTQGSLIILGELLSYGGNFMCNMTKYTEAGTLIVLAGKVLYFIQFYNDFFASSFANFSVSFSYLFCRTISKIGTSDPMCCN
jgi:hypothetical protein